MFNMVKIIRGVSLNEIGVWLLSAFALGANTLTTLTHPAGQTAGSTPQAGAQSGPAPATVIGQFTKTVYTVTSNAISSVDTRDLIPLLSAGWV